MPKLKLGTVKQITGNFSNKNEIDNIIDNKETEINNIINSVEQSKQEKIEEHVNSLFESLKALNGKLHNNNDIKEQIKSALIKNIKNENVGNPKEPNKHPLIISFVIKSETPNNYELTYTKFKRKRNKLSYRNK